MSVTPTTGWATTASSCRPAAGVPDAVRVAADRGLGGGSGLPRRAEPPAPALQPSGPDRHPVGPARLSLLPGPAADRRRPRRRWTDRGKPSGRYGRAEVLGLLTGAGAQSARWSKAARASST